MEMHIGNLAKFKPVGEDDSKQEMADILFNIVKNHRDVITEEEKHWCDGILCTLYHLGYISKDAVDEWRWYH